jgi:hypothetical protein
MLISVQEVHKSTIEYIRPHVGSVINKHVGITEINKSKIKTV